jgi:GT2 family glycosyltransferase
LLTCHNRRDKTLAALRAYHACELPIGVERLAVLVDDGSSDGTAEAVASDFPSVLIERGDGSLFWNRGTLRAWQCALALQPDHVLWLNDDTLLYRDALLRMYATEDWGKRKYHRGGVCVGSTENGHGEITYGGSIPSGGLNRLRLRRVAPAGAPQEVMTMNGNCVLVPKAVWEQIGLIDGVFRHAMGDMDYGFRASKAGVPVVLAPGMIGTCENDHGIAGSYADRSLSLRMRWKKITSSKSLPPHAWYVLCRRHAGIAWPLVWMLPYARLLLSAMRVRP